MKDEIKEILEQLEWYRKIGKKDVFYPEYVLSNKKAFMLLDYITNLQKTQETLIKNDNEIITNLQEENEYNNYCNEELRKKITNLEYKNERLEEDNKQLKELCDKYEEEHSTTFNYWKQLIKEDYKSRCEKAIEYIKDNLYYCVDNDDTNLLNILKGSE